MSAEEQRCQLDSCNRAASTHCFCCHKNVCTRHLIEHIDGIKAQIAPLANEISITVNKIQDLTIEQIIEAPFMELQQWRTDMHQLIDSVFLAKSKEIDDLAEINKDKFAEHKNQQYETIVKIQEDVKQLLEDGDATLEQIKSLKSRLANVEISLTSFLSNFLLIHVRVSAEKLVTVSSNLNTPRLPQTFMFSPTTKSTNPVIEARTPPNNNAVFETKPVIPFPSFGQGFLFDRSGNNTLSFQNVPSNSSSPFASYYKKK